MVSLSNSTLLLSPFPQINHLFESSFTRDESSASNAGVSVIPTQFKVTHQILRNWHPFRDLQLKFVGSHDGSLCAAECLLVHEKNFRNDLPKRHMMWVGLKALMAYCAS